MKHSSHNELQTLVESIAKFDSEQTVLVGIRTGGAWVAQHINRQLPSALPLGVLDISFYRDDFTQIGLNPNVQASNIGFSIENKHVVLIDDVLYTGRTIRAALNELFDFGRPSKVTLAVLLERDGRQLPIHADLYGKQLQLKDTQYIKIHGGEDSPIEYEVKDHT